METTIATHIALIQERIATAAQRAGRNPSDITLVAVTKTHPPDIIAHVIAAGISHIAENRLQEAQHKIAAVSTLLPGVPIQWHFIGHVQRNKARLVAQLFYMVQSLDSTRLADALNEHIGKQSASPQDKPLPVLLQVNVSGEASKEGFIVTGDITDSNPHVVQLYHDVAHIITLPHLAVHGLMTVAPYATESNTVRPVFRRVRLLRDALAQRFPNANWHTLSMGMTNDFPVAIEEGATLVRIGRALFGERTD